MGMTGVRARSLALEFVPVLAAAGATAVAAQITIPFWPVPFTLQTAAVLASGLCLGARRGAAAQLAYLSAGAAGAPVFAGALGGPQILFGPTGGYLLAFVASAFAVGLAAENWKGWRLGLSLVAASILTLGVGATWLSTFIGAAAWKAGLLLFLPAEMLKAGAAWAVYRSAKR